MRALTMPLVFMCVGLVVQVSQLAFAETHDIVSPKTITGEEFLGVHHVLDILGNTNVYRLDKASVKTFQEYTDIKSAVNDRPIDHTAVVSPKAYPQRLAAPRKINNRLF